MKRRSAEWVSLCFKSFWCLASSLISPRELQCGEAHILRGDMPPFVVENMTSETSSRLSYASFFLVIMRVQLSRPAKRIRV